jgi:hypothetical protein
MSSARRFAVTGVALDMSMASAKARSAAQTHLPRGFTADASKLNISWCADITWTRHLGRLRLRRLWPASAEVTGAGPCPRMIVVARGLPLDRARHGHGQMGDLGGRLGNGESAAVKSGWHLGYERDVRPLCHAYGYDVDDSDAHAGDLGGLRCAGRG